MLIFLIFFIISHGEKRFLNEKETKNCLTIMNITFTSSMQVVYSDCTMVKLTAPYIPGFLAFREAEFLIEKVHHLQEIKPEYMPQVQYTLYMIYHIIIINMYI